MRLHRLEVSAFLAFGGTEVVDFDALSDAGLFLLQGPTGAGKSSILDAVCFALFGSISDARPGGEELRSHHAAPGLKTSVTLDVTLRGRRLKIVRTPKQERLKRRGEGTTLDAHTVSIFEITAAGEQPLSSGAQEASAELAELMGMSREQFRQVVMLPQGGFAQVLHADSAERERLLRGLFDVSKFSSVERWLKDQAASARHEREAAEANVDQALMLAAHHARNEPAQDEAPAVWLRQQADLASKQRDVSATQQARCAKLHKQATEQLVQARERQRAHDAAQAAAAKANAALEAAGADATTDLASLREQAAELREQAGATRALAGREDELAAARKALEQAAAEQTKWEHEATAATLEHEREQSGRPDREKALARSLEAAARLDGLVDALEQNKRRALAGAERDGTQLAIDELEQELQTLRELANAAKERHLELRQAHLDGYAARLAAQLRDGEACLVCGSTDHPAPHGDGDGQGPTETEVEQASAEEEQTAARRDRALDQLAERRNDLATAIAIAADTPHEELVAAVDAAHQAHSLAVIEAGQATALQSELDSLEERLSHLQAKAQHANEQAAACRSTQSAIATKVKELEAELSDARGNERSVAERAEALAAKAQLIEAAADAIDEARAAKELAGESEPVGLDELERAERASADSLQASSEDLALQTERAAQLNELVEVYRSASEAADPLIERHELLRGLHEFADGTSISNEKRMRLTTYVLAARLEQVAEAATDRLRQMSRGRYELVHSDEHRGRKARGGLDLRVFDTHTGYARAPKSLSGGETFYASLALALGLADVISAETGGIRLDTLFIDEGFGTLDDEGTLEDVLVVLDELRSGGRAVGVVSHVRELRDRISAQLRIEPGITGSRVIQGEQAEPRGGVPSLREELQRIDDGIAVEPVQLQLTGSEPEPEVTPAEA